MAPMAWNSSTDCPSSLHKSVPQIYDTTSKPTVSHALAIIEMHRDIAANCGMETDTTNCQAHAPDDATKMQTLS
eukprot:2865101-Amphidinium_carterae.1